MAGDWIKMRCNLWDDPRVAGLCDLTDAKEATIIGGLYWLWATADQHSEHGVMPAMTSRSIDRKTGIKGFGAALISIGWLEENPDGVCLARFDEHNGESAKVRAQTARRVSRHKGNAQVTQAALLEDESANGGSVTKDGKSNGDSVRGALPREEKRREEEKRMSIAAAEVLEYLNAKADRNFEPVASNTKLIIARLREGATLERLKAVVDAKVAEWLDDPKMQQYLRPATLFNAEKFGQYSGLLGSRKTNGSSVLSEYDDLMRGAL